MPISGIRRSQVNFPPFAAFPTQATATEWYLQDFIWPMPELAPCFCPACASGPWRSVAELGRGAAPAAWTGSPWGTLHPGFSLPVVARFLSFKEEELFYSSPRVNSAWNAQRRQLEPWFSTCALQTLGVCGSLLR